MRCSDLLQNERSIAAMLLASKLIKLDITGKIEQKLLLRIVYNNKIYLTTEINE